MQEILTACFAIALNGMNTLMRKIMLTWLWHFHTISRYAGLYSAKCTLQKHFRYGAKVIVSNGLSNIDGGWRICRMWSSLLHNFLVKIIFIRLLIL